MPVPDSPVVKGQAEVEKLDRYFCFMARYSSQSFG